MKAVIPAAGKGTRMLHLTNNKSKVLIKIRQKPFLFYVLQNLKKAGFQDLILVVGYKDEKFREFLKEYDFNVTVVNQFEVLGEKDYGTLCAVKAVENLVAGENFLTIYGDNLYSAGDLRNFNLSDNYNYVGGFISECPEKYGVLFSEGEYLKKIVEKPKKHIGNMVNAGIYKFTPEIFEKIPQVGLSERGEYELTDAVSLLAKEGKVKIKQIKDYKIDFGNPGDIMKVCRFLKKYGDFKD